MNLESMFRKLSLLVLAVTVAACGGEPGDDASATATPRGEPPAAPAQAAESVADDYTEYRLTMPEVRSWYEAQSNIYDTIRENPELLDDIESAMEASTVAALESRLGGISQVRTAVSRAGLDMRRYAVIMLGLYHAKSVDEAIQSGADRAQTIANRQVNPANVELIEQNRAEIERLERGLGEIEMQ